MSDTSPMRPPRLLPRSWHVLLIGGASGTGKSRLAVELGRQYGVNVLHLDDIQIALDTVTTPREQPLLHFWRTNWDDFVALTDDQHVEHFVSISRTVFDPILEALITDRLDGGPPTIIEGDFILPELLGRLAQGTEPEASVQALFLVEHDELQLAANFVERHGGDATLPAHTSWLKSRWLHRESERLGLTALATRPWETAARRATDALASSPR